MAENGHTNHTKTYLYIFGALAVLTAIEVGITQIGMPKTPMIILLIALALVKAGLVAVYFMHLKYDAAFLKVIAYSPLAVASILILMLSLEWAFQPHWLF
ncbi:MAG TPA: cytochrome C oxidase subunit IV family protein [Candidatus Kapabacteria bacterium]|nr:cytochrome C oxidase subunit IV family protein [Candidatus Kapabacteria bacterium]